VDNIKMDLREIEKWLNALKMFSLFFFLYMYLKGISTVLENLLKCNKIKLYQTV
jgi:hypothetical protein